MRPSPHPRSTTTSSFVALATSSILRTTSCGEETNGAQLILFQTLYAVASGVMIKLFKQLCPRIARDSSIWPVVMINDTRIHELSKAELKEPVLIQGLPGLGYVGRSQWTILSRSLSRKNSQNSIPAIFSSRTGILGSIFRRMGPILFQSTSSTPLARRSLTRYSSLGTHSPA